MKERHHKSQKIQTNLSKTTMHHRHLRNKHIHLLHAHCRVERGVLYQVTFSIARNPVVF